MIDDMTNLNPSEPVRVDSALLRAAVAVAAVANLPASAIAGVVEVLRQHCASEDEILTVEETAALLKTSRDVISDLCRLGRLPSLQVGTGKHKCYRIRRSDLALLNHVQEDAPPPSTRRQRHRRDQTPNYV